MLKYASLLTTHSLLMESTRQKGVATYIILSETLLIYSEDDSEHNISDNESDEPYKKRKERKMQNIQSQNLNQNLKMISL